jgi:hypothetical protein
MNGGREEEGRKKHKRSGGRKVFGLLIEVQTQTHTFVRTQ